MKWSLKIQQCLVSDKDTALCYGFPICYPSACKAGGNSEQKGKSHTGSAAMFVLSNRVTMGITDMYVFS